MYSSRFFSGAKKKSVLTFLVAGSQFGLKKVPVKRIMSGQFFSGISRRYYIYR